MSNREAMTCAGFAIGAAVPVSHGHVPNPRQDVQPESAPMSTKASSEMLVLDENATDLQLMLPA